MGWQLNPYTGAVGPGGNVATVNMNRPPYGDNGDGSGGGGQQQPWQPYQYQMGPMEQQAMAYWNQQKNQAGETPEQAATRRGIYAAGLAPEATARLAEGMGQYIRGGQSGAGRQFVGETIAGYEGGLRQGLAQSDYQAAMDEAKMRQGYAGMGLQAGVGFGNIGLGYAGLGEQARQFDTSRSDYQQQLAEQEEWLQQMMSLYS